MFDWLHLISIPLVFLAGAALGVYVTLPSTKKLLAQVRADIAEEVTDARIRIRDEVEETLDEIKAAITERL